MEWLLHKNATISGPGGGYAKYDEQLQQNHVNIYVLVDV